MFLAVKFKKIEVLQKKLWMWRNQPDMFWLYIRALKVVLNQPSSLQNLDSLQHSAAVLHHWLSQTANKELLFQHDIFDLITEFLIWRDGKPALRKPQQKHHSHNPLNICIMGKSHYHPQSYCRRPAGFCSCV